MGLCISDKSVHSMDCMYVRFGRIRNTKTWSKSIENGVVRYTKIESLKITKV